MRLGSQLAPTQPTSQLALLAALVATALEPAAERSYEIIC